MASLILIFLGVLSRLAPHPANVTAIGGLALFTGARLSLKRATATVFVTMFISDLILGFHSVMWATYGGMLAGVFIGKYVVRERGAGWIVGGTIASSVIFYLVTNFAVWYAPNTLYPKTLDGLWLSYIMALPFFRNSLVGDVVYSTLFFAGYEFVRSLRIKQSANEALEIRTGR
jgi:hypothetical protein